MDKALGRKIGLVFSPFRLTRLGPTATLKLAKGGMQFNVSTLLKEHIGATREHALDDELRIDGKPRRIAGSVRFDRTKDGILVRALLHGIGEGECSRCLKALSFPVEIGFEEEYIPVVDFVSGGRIEPPEGEEDAYRINARHILDLSEAAEQYWAMSAPMAPACIEDCGERCRICGRFIIGQGHDCAGAAETDSRWAKLGKLKADLSRGRSP